MNRVPEREAAKAAGERFYSTGKPCKNGHLSKRYTGTGICAACAVKNTMVSQAKRPWHPNRTAARDRAELHYSTGVPCKHGHDRRFVANGICVECSSVWSRRYLKNRPGLEAQWARERRAKDPTGHRAEVKRWRQKNPEKAAKTRERWVERNPEIHRKRNIAAVHRRRARVAVNGGSFTAEDIDELRRKQRGRCAACNSRGKLQVDHKIAVVNGGSNDPSNLQLLCGHCNRSKGRKDAILWAQEHGRLL